MVASCAGWLWRDSLHLIAIDGPILVGRRLATVHFEVRTGADFFDEFSDRQRFAAVLGPLVLDPTPKAFVLEGELTTNAEQ